MLTPRTTPHAFLPTGVFRLKTILKKKKKETLLVLMELYNPEASLRKQQPTQLVIVVLNLGHFFFLQTQIYIPLLCFNLHGPKSPNCLFFGRNLLKPQNPQAAFSSSPQHFLHTTYQLVDSKETAMILMA